MKNKIIFLGLLVLTTIVSSCKKDEIFATKQQSPGTIIFVVDDKALTGSAFAGVVQPSLDVSAARFSKATTSSPNYFAGNSVITFNTTNISKIVVNLVVSTGTDKTVPAIGTREKKAELTVSGGSTVWTAPLNTLQYGGTVPANNAVITLEVIGTTTDGQTTSRIFQVTVIA